ncbi:MAG: hypothetical protein ABI867_40160 [Kofleriaceae bacterium]
MRIAVVLVLALANVAHADKSGERQAAVAAIPELATVAQGRARVTVRGRLAARQHKPMVALVEQVIRDVERRFLATKGDAHPAITLCLFDDATRYHDLAAVFGSIPSDLGFYLPRHRVAIANVGLSVGNLRHELVHPLVDDDFPDIPAWLTEGLGALYGTARWTDGRFEFLVNYRLRDLQAALKANKLPGLATLARAGFAEVHGPDAGMYYAYGRYVLLYLDRRNTLSAFYAAMRAATGDVREQTKLLEQYVDDKAFRAWARALRY